MAQDLREASVNSAAEVRALSESLARQASELYAGLAQRMEELGNPRAAAAFERIGAIATSHHSPSGSASAGGASLVFNHEDLGSSRLITPYDAFSLAVRNSERAFVYWVHVSAHAEDPEVRVEAERAARVEMDHVRELRAGRRHAFHDGQHTRSSTETLRAATPADTRQELANREAALADLHGRIADRLDDMRDPWARVLAEIASEEAANAANYGPMAETASREPLPGDSSRMLSLAVERLEAAVEFYLKTAGEARDEAVVSAAQILASRGVQRLVRLREI